MSSQIPDAFQVIEDHSRRDMLLLSKDSMTINALAENFDRSRPAVSKHGKSIYNTGFIFITGFEQESHCVLKQDGFNKLQDFTNYFDTCWINKLQKLQSRLATLTNSPI